MNELLTTSPNGNLKVSINGDFGNGMKVTGAYLAPVTSKGTRWINVFYKKGKGVGAEVLADGSFSPDCADSDLPVYKAVYDAAIEQYTK